MATKPIKIELDLNDRDAKRKLQELARETGNAEDAFGDAESAGKAMARAIEAAADDMIQEIDATKRAVDALERNLGDLDADPREVVADLKRIGLTAEDIEADAEELARALQRSGDVKVHAAKAGFDDLGQAVGSVRDETGRAKDTMSGFIGGTVGELPGISEAFGPLGEGLGQLTEGALNGEVAFKQLAIAGGLMGGVAIGMQLVAKHMANQAKIKAFNKEQVKDWADAIYDAEDALEGMTDAYRNAGQIEVDTLLDGIKDITSTLARAGITVDDWTRYVQGGEAAMVELDGKLKAAGISGDAYNHVILGAMTSQGKYAEATEDAAERTAVFGDSTDDAAEAAERAAEAQDAQTEALEATAEALQENIDKLTEQIEAQLEAVDAGYALEKAQFALTDAVTAANEVFGNAESTARDYREAELSVIDAANNVARAEQRKAEETAKANGTTLTATQRTDILNSSLLNQAATLNGPARQAILNHIGQLNGIPASKMTQINAAIDRGDIATAESLINSTSRTRTAAVQATTDRNALNQTENDLNYITRPRTVSVRTSGGGGLRMMARGTPYASPGPAIVGEDGPEIVNLNSGDSVTPAAQSAGLIGRSGGGTTVNNYITQNFPAGARPTDVNDAQRRWTKRNGPS